jgi:hypothetical protein
VQILSVKDKHDKFQWSQQLEVLTLKGKFLFQLGRYEEVRLL